MRLFLFIINILMCGLIVAQESPSKDFYKEIQKYNVADLWTVRKIQVEDDTTLLELLEPIGFIGPDFQRFYIHFSSVIQNPNNRYEYLINGQTRVMRNIRTFQGRFKIDDSRLYLEADLPSVKQGYIIGDYELFEDSVKKGTGILKGKFRSDFYITNDDKLKYDAISLMADGFENNQFEGTWTEYKTGIKRVCNWGDFRIPGSVGLDEGTGEFMPTAKYLNRGWKNYLKENEYRENVNKTHKWWQQINNNNDR